MPLCTNCNDRKIMVCYWCDGTRFDHQLIQPCYVCLGSQINKYDLPCNYCNGTGFDLHTIFNCCLICKAKGILICKNCRDEKAGQMPISK